MHITLPYIIFVYISCFLNLQFFFFFPVQLLENMTEVVRKGILEAELQLQKASEEKLMEEVRFCVSWFKLLHITVKAKEHD